jgi:hypothetical protein
MSGTEVDEGELRQNMLVFLSIQWRVHWFNMLVFLSIQWRVHWFAHPIPPLAGQLSPGFRVHWPNSRSREGPAGHPGRLFLSRITPRD